MPRPKGIPKTGGRQKGSINKRKRLLQEKALVRVEVTPLQFMLNVMRGTAIPKRAPPEVKAQLIALQFDAAKAAAPYVHARLGAIVTTSVPTGEAVVAAGAEVAQLEPEKRSALEIGRRIAFTLAMAAEAQKKPVEVVPQ